MTTKTCFKCLCNQPLEAFYKHARMGDGHLNKCKECTKKDVAEHRQNNLEKIRAYDKFRASVPHRVAARKEYANTPEGKAAHAKALKLHRVMFPKKAHARYAVSNALRDGKLQKDPCHICGAIDVEGHHPDYDNPLGVVWLCKPHHMQLHKQAANHMSAGV